jgi:hypothetical protein
MIHHCPTLRAESGKNILGDLHVDRAHNANLSREKGGLCRQDSMTKH